MAGRESITEPVEFETAKGLVFRVKPVQGGLGLAVIPVLPKAKAAGGTGRRGGAGRPPSPSTLRLRERLEADAKEGLVRAPSHYVDFLLQQEPGLKPATAQQRVYKERSAVLDAHPKVKMEKRAKTTTKKSKRAKKSKGAGGPRGRQPSPALEKLRAKLQKDKEAGGLKEPKHYIQWALDQDKKIGLKQARSMVYRERQAMTQ